MCFEFVSYLELFDHSQALADQRTFLLAPSPYGTVSGPEHFAVGRYCTTSLLFAGTLDDRCKQWRIGFVDSEWTFRIVYDPTSRLSLEISDGFLVPDP